VFAMGVRAGERILLCTDGVIEAENAKGGPFGRGKFGEVLLRHQGMAGGEFVEKVLKEMRGWQPAGMDRQDVITIAAVDVRQGTQEQCRSCKPRPPKRKEEVAVPPRLTPLFCNAFFTGAEAPRSPG